MNAQKGIEMAYDNPQPRKVVTFAQLLAKAKRQGLRGVRTEIIQLPTEANKQTAVFRATATMLDSIGEAAFDGTGEATPQNVKPAMILCLPRIAETRAIVRALKLAVGEGDVAMEELSDYDDTQQPVAVAPRQRASELNGPISTDQMNAVRNLCTRKGLDPEAEARAAAQVSLENLSAAQAGKLIADLGKRPVATA